MSRTDEDPHENASTSTRTHPRSNREQFQEITPQELPRQVAPDGVDRRFYDGPGSPRVAMSNFELARLGPGGVQRTPLPPRDARATRGIHHSKAATGHGGRARGHFPRDGRARATAPITAAAGRFNPLPPPPRQRSSGWQPFVDEGRASARPRRERIESGRPIDFVTIWPNRARFTHAGD